MTCFCPLSAYRALTPDPVTGKRALTFNPLHAVDSVFSLKLPCGQCSGCRHDKAAEWAIRCGHEASTSPVSCFVTLTYEDEALPVDYSVKKRDLQLFMKRLRVSVSDRVRFFACGEYGDTGGRPHYHALLFGVDFSDDRKRWSKRGEHQTWKSDQLEALWPHGHSEIGSVTPHSAGYVARYCLKKFTGKKADDHYFRASPVDGATYRVEPEFALMSRRPGLGTEWFNRFSGDAFPSDFLIVDGKRRPVPGFYVRKLEAEPVGPAAPGFALRHEASAEVTPIKRARKAKAAKPAAKWNRSSARLAVREEVHASRAKRLVRTL